MNEEEVQIDLMTLLHYILRKWRSIIVVMLIVAVAANLYSVKKSMSVVASVSAAEEEVDIEKQIENAKEELTADELEQVERVYSMYEHNLQLYQENEEKKLKALNVLEQDVVVKPKDRFICMGTVLGKVQGMPDL